MDPSKKILMVLATCLAKSGSLLFESCSTAVNRSHFARLPKGTDEKAFDTPRRAQAIRITAKREASDMVDDKRGSLQTVESNDRTGLVLKCANKKDLSLTPL